MIQAISDIETAPDDSTRKQIAKRAFRRRVGDGRFSDGGHVLAVDFFLLAGDIEGARKAADEIANRVDALEWVQFKRVLNYYRDPTPRAEKELLALSRPFRSEVCFAEQSVGMVALARGQIRKAEDHFRRSSAVGKFDWWSHVWSSVFLHRIENDPSWPHWIEKSEGASSGQELNKW